MSSILFYKYIRGILDSMIKSNLVIIFLSFVDDPNFIIARFLVKKLAITLRQVAQMVLE